MSGIVDPEHDELFSDAKSALNSLPEADDSSSSPRAADLVYDQLLDAVPEADCSSPPALTATLDGLKRARGIKATINKRLSILKPKTMRARPRTVEEDPDNQAIKTMRQEHNMSWEAIVAHLNNERLERGEPQTWTSAAVYSRFVRNAPRIAAAHGEIGFSPRDCKWHPKLHLKTYR
jgi:hypothetical protein